MIAPVAGVCLYSMHHTKDKGDLGVLKAQVDLCEQGFLIMNPLTEHAAFDLVAYRDGKFYRVQVKYRKLDRSGKLDIKFSTCWADRIGIHTVPIAPQDFRSHVSLRVSTPRNGQRSGVNMAADYRRVP